MAAEVILTAEADVAHRHGVIFTKQQPLCRSLPTVISGEGALVLGSFSRLAAALAVVTLIAGGPAHGAGALAVGHCGAYGHAYDFKDARAAMVAAQKQCKGNCKAVPMKRACAAFSVDMTNPCGAHGFAVASRISTAQNTAMRNCYKFGGKECVIRAWACDARG